mgnify:CR=1 FL=1
MKLHFFYGLSFAILAGMLEACNNDNDASIQQSANEYQDVFEQTIKFAGNTYHVPCTIENDSLIYLDEEFNSLFKSTISQMPERTAFISKDENGNDVIEYFSSEQELIKEKGLVYFNDFECQETTDNVKGRANAMPEPKAGRAILYDDSGFKDRTVTLDADYDRYPSIANLKAYAGFNDKTSAIRVFNFLEPNTYYRPSYASPNASVKGSQLRTCLIGYEDSDFKGNKLFCVATYSSSQNINKPETASHQDYKLKNIGWNDKISSCVFRIITVNNINNGSVTPHP